ncbi:bifunctional enoyl-CoA hydratase/phosphate acetyltransferase [Terracidiphilus gabretensis]|uniref:bifunctional enoyl-CoA hydratase/phosphate acetyltransferase n=1 Tax=Terracidiphilus gabretensis TaxID=1577687 RepID=UPI00071BB068|nr:bifunctional enoyl-CoA hydratase/phosphate acetyltransferase [Terracidiphilus gabretensis]
MIDLLAMTGAPAQERQTHYLLEEVIRAAQGRPAFPVAVAWPLSAVSFAGAVEAAEAGIIYPLFIGPEQKLKEIAASLNFDIASCEVVEARDEVDAAAKAVDLCRVGRANALMKGSLHTDVFMHSALKKDAGLRTSRRISHVFVLEAPLYDRTLFITDAAINIYPALEDKVDILQNAIELAHVLGVAEPRTAILSAVETVSPKIISTIDAAALCKMADRGQITGAILDGPLAFDTAVNAEAARVKHLKSPVAGVADIFLVPDLESGNMLAKQLEYLGGARLAGIVLGASVPIILTSRADSSESRVASCAIASALIADKQ